MIEIEWLLLMLFLQSIKCNNNVSHIYYPKMDIAFELLQYICIWEMSSHMFT